MMAFLVMYKDMEWCRKVLRCGIGYFRHCAIDFVTLRLSREKIIELSSRPRGGIITTTRKKYDACG